MSIEIKDQNIIVRFGLYLADVEILNKRHQINELFEKHSNDIKEMLLDFSEVKVIDVKGFNYLIELYIRCTKKQWMVHIIHCSRLIAKQLETFKLDCLFNTKDIID